MDFGRQPKPVKVILEGDPIDVTSWMRALMRRAESSGDMAQQINDNSFTIYPRAVND
jgi:hypothetical protein